MPSRTRSSRPALPAAVFASLALALVPVFAGCGLIGDAREGETIPPASAGTATDLGLGPGVRPLSFGPGDKGSPRVSPSGEKVAFVLDGYVAEKPLYAQTSLPRTASDFGAGQSEWLTDEGIAILTRQDEAGAGGVRTPPAPNSLFNVRPGSSSSDGSSDVARSIENVTAVGSVPDGGAVAAVTVAPESLEEPTPSRLVLLRDSEQPASVYLRSIKGYVTGLSISPDGRRAVVAVRRNAGGDEARFEVQTYEFSEGRASRVARLPAGTEILGAPQWTRRGIHFVAGEATYSAADDRNPADYDLYRVPVGSGTPEQVRGIGEDFVAASIRVSPDGQRLAVVGRRNPGFPTNLYVLDLASDTLEGATANENMEVKTNPLDLTWSPDGNHVILVARGAFSGPEVYDAPAQTLSSAFYNLYEVPVTNLPIEAESES
ncbi:MAG: LpqB family beta-propeller domain-containing protein [Actinomycetota bacterium]|nr:LpqB family beta-propeller domain-containing protein [Actinomycetota bacterium]